MENDIVSFFGGGDDDSNSSCSDSDEVYSGGSSASSSSSGSPPCTPPSSGHHGRHHLAGIKNRMSQMQEMADQNHKQKLLRQHQHMIVDATTNSKERYLIPEPSDGNVEYKLKLVEPSESRFEHLVTQMKWRLREGQGEAIYEIGTFNIYCMNCIIFIIILYTKDILAYIRVYIGVYMCDK